MRLEKKVIFEIFGAVAILAAGIVLFITTGREDKFGSRIYPGYPSRIFIEAINNYRTGNYKRAEEIFERIVEKEKNKKILSTAYLYMGNIQALQGHYKQASELYNLSLRYDKNNYYSSYNIAVLNVERGYIEKAINICEDVYRKWPKFTINAMLLANLYYSKSKYSSAASIFSTINDNPLVQYNLAMCYMKIGCEDRALEMLEGIFNNEAAPDVLRGLSAVYIGARINEVPIAHKIRAFELAMGIFPEVSKLQYYLALLKIENRNLHGASELLFNLCGEERDPAMIELYLYTLFKRGKFARALDDLARFFPREEGLPNGIVGDFYLAEKRYNRAIEYYSKALHDGKIQGHVFYNLISLYIKEKRVQDALDLISKMKEKLGDSFYYELAKAKLNFSIGKEGMAYENLMSALRKSKSSIDRNIVINELEKYGYQDRVIDLYLSEDYSRNVTTQEYVRAIMRVATIYLKRGHREIALKFLNRIRDKIESTEDYYRFMVLFAESGGGSEKEKIYKRLIAEFPYMPEAYVNLALYYARSRQYRRALKIIDESFTRTDVKMNPEIYDDILRIKEFCEQK